MSALRADVVVDPLAVVAPVRCELFGAFVEHLGRCVYTGIFEPDHPSADDAGFRTDVLDLVRHLGVSQVRYPGGNFVSGYRWEDGVGPVENRPRRRDLAWHCVEPNTFGVDEFLTWAGRAGVEPTMAVNLGTRGIQEALDLLEYTNAHSGTAFADLRRSHGRAEPYGVRRWCLGNEIDGPWQIGHKTAHEYGRLAAETARAMRMADPDLILTACGSSGPDMATFGDWEATVLAAAYDEIDLISAHCYFFEEDGDLGSFLASGVRLDGFLSGVAATADHARTVRRSAKRIDIALDEWNVWYMHGEASRLPTGDDWPVAPPLLEDRYSVADAVVVGGLLISVLRHCDRVAAANLAQLVNVIAPIMTEPGGPAWCQTTFHPFALTSHLARGVVLAPRIVADPTDTARYGPVDAIDAVATWEVESGRLAVFAVNRSPVSALRIRVDARGFGAAGSVAGRMIADPDPYRVPDRDDPSPVTPVPLATAVDEDGVVVAELPPASWVVLEVGDFDVR